MQRVTQKLECFSHKVREIRKQLSLSQEELAQTLGVSFATVNRWENGKTTPSKLAQLSFEKFRENMTRQGKLRHESL